MKARLDAAVKAGGLTKAQEQHILGMLTKGIHGFVTHGFPFGMRMPDASAPAAPGL